MVKFEVPALCPQIVQVNPSPKCIWEVQRKKFSGATSSSAVKHNSECLTGRYTFCTDLSANCRSYSRTWTAVPTGERKDQLNGGRGRLLYIDNMRTFSFFQYKLEVETVHTSNLNCSSKRGALTQTPLPRPLLPSDEGRCQPDVENQKLLHIFWKQLCW